MRDWTVQRLILVYYKIKKIKKNKNRYCKDGDSRSHKRKKSVLTNYCRKHKDNNKKQLVIERRLSAMPRLHTGGGVRHRVHPSPRHHHVHPSSNHVAAVLNALKFESWGRSKDSPRCHGCTLGVKEFATVSTRVRVTAVSIRVQTVSLPRQMAWSSKVEVEEDMPPTSVAVVSMSFTCLTSVWQASRPVRASFKIPKISSEVFFNKKKGLADICHAHGGPATIFQQEMHSPMAVCLICRFLITLMISSQPWHLPFIRQVTHWKCNVKF